MQSRGSMQQAGPHEPHARHREYFSLWQQPQASHPGGLAIAGVCGRDMSRAASIVLHRCVCNGGCFQWQNVILAALKTPRNHTHLYVAIHCSREDATWEGERRSSARSVMLMQIAGFCSLFVSQSPNCESVPVGTTHAREERKKNYQTGGQS